MTKGAALKAVMASPRSRKQLLPLVFGGEPAEIGGTQFNDLGRLDDAQRRYFICHLHRLLDPRADRRPKR